MIRRAWGELPERVRAEIASHAGDVVEVTPAPAGRHSEFSATLRTSGPAGRVFVKGITADHPDARAHRHEMYVSRWLPRVAVRLLWTVEVDGWLMLGFEHVAGRHANLSPGSADLPLVRESLSILAEALNPCPVDNAPAMAGQWARFAAWRRLRHDPPADIHPWSRANLGRFVEWERQAIEAVGGTCLAHTDLHSLNVLIDGSARVVDWAWSRRAAPWVDAAFLVLRLIQAGHPPAAAERWAADVPCWHTASESDRTAFAVGVLGLWEYLEHHRPLPHRAALTRSARRWARHRLENG